MPALILASGSAYRRELLARLGLPFETISPDVDESPEPLEAPAALACRLARAKALAVDAADAIVVGSDQVASLDDRLLGKPGTPQAALEQLLACQGREVHFHTAVCVVDTAGAIFDQTVDLTRVRFRQLTRAEIETYIAREPALDCAGGFKAEGLGIALFSAIESADPTALIGLPLIWLAATLRRCGLDPLTTDASFSAGNRQRN